jgi:hypothetical protein
MRRRQALAALGATALDNEAAILGRHPRAEAVRLSAAAIVRLKGSFRHSQQFSIKTKSVRLKAGGLSVKKAARCGAQLKTGVEPSGILFRKALRR